MTTPFVDAGVGTRVVVDCDEAGGTSIGRAVKTGADRTCGDARRLLGAGTGVSTIHVGGVVANPAGDGLRIGCALRTGDVTGEAAVIGA